MIEAEKAVIGSLSIRPEAINELDFLKPEMFETDVYRDIYVKFCDLAKDKPDALMIANALASDGRYSQSSIIDIMTGAMSGVVVSTNVRGYAKTVRDEYRKRWAERMVAMFRPTAGTIDHDLQELQADITSLMAGVDDDGMTLAEITEAVKDKYFIPRDRNPLGFGIAEIDDACGGMDGGDLIVIAARPAVGKSAFILQSMRQFTAKGRNVAYFNLEMMQEQVFERAVATASGIELNAIRKNTRFHGNEKADYEAGVGKLLQEDKITVYQGAWTVSKIRAVQARKHFDVIVVDYLQLITPDGKRMGNRTAEVGDISRGLKCIATDYGIPVIALSQLNRASEQNKDREPTMSELRESGAIEQDASIILMLWNSNVDDDSERGIKVEKARQGRRTKITTYFDGRYMTFECFGHLRFEEAEDTPFD